MRIIRMRCAFLCAIVITAATLVGACGGSGGGAPSGSGAGSSPVGDATAPTIPANITPSAISPTRVDVSWTASSDNVGVTGYRVYRGGTYLADTTNTGYVDTGVTAGATYSYTVAAFDAAGNYSTPSAAASVTTPVASPTVGQIFADDFESGDLSRSQNGARWTNSTATRAALSPNGTWALEFTYPADPEPLPSGYEGSWSEQRFHLGSNYPDIWLAYDLYVPPNYLHPNRANNKAFGYLFSGGYGNNELTGPLLATNFWPDGDTGESLMSHWYRSPVLPAGRHLWPNDSAWIDSRGIRLADRGTWLRIVIHAKYATAANNDGMYELWINGAQKMRITNGDWYVPNQLGFDQGYLLGWANSGFAQETKFYIDNIVFATNELR